MPLQMQDLIPHLKDNTSLRGSIEAAIEAIASRFQAVDSAANLNAALADLKQHKSGIVDAVFHGITGTHTNLRAGETPKVPGDNGEMAPGYNAEDPRTNANIAESQANPMLPRDASGHKVHPADAMGGGGAAATDQAKAAGFGGSGTEVSAANRTDAPTRFSSRPDPAKAGAADGLTPGQIAARQRMAERQRANAQQQNGPA